MSAIIADIKRVVLYQWTCPKCGHDHYTSDKPYTGKLMYCDNCNVSVFAGKHWEDENEQE